MTPDATREVLEELRDVLEDESVELVESYEVWGLPAQSLDLRRDARFARRVHHQARTSSGLTYARSAMRELDELDLAEIGNSQTAAQIEAAAARLGEGDLRLLLLPSRQIIALWNPDQAKLAVALSGTAAFAPEEILSEASFEARLGDMAVSGKPSSGVSTEDIAHEGASRDNIHVAAPPPKRHTYARDRLEKHRQRRFTTRFATEAAAPLAA